MGLIDLAQVRTIATIGAGTVGASWAAWFLSGGARVHCSDPGPDAEVKARALIAGAWPSLMALGRANETFEEAIERLRFFADPGEAAAGAEFVQESAPERLDLKRELLQRIDAALPAGRVIASSTSGLMPSEIQEGMANPGRMVVGHPFNPPHLIPLVEVVGGRATDVKTVDWAMAFYAAQGKHPIRLNKEVPGHVANRLQAVLWREVVHLIDEGVASAADVDAAIAEGPGLRWAMMGPTLTFHLAGGDKGIRHFIEHLGPSMSRWWNDAGKTELTPALSGKLEAEMRAVSAGRDMKALAAGRDRKLVGILRAVSDR